MDQAQAFGGANVTIQARVFRIAWDRRPSWVPKALWLWLGKKRVGFTGRWENLGIVASSDEGTASIAPAGVVHTSPSSARG